MKIDDLKQLKKLSEMGKLEAAPPSVLGAVGRGETLRAIIEVKEPGYTPAEVQVRTRISPVIFTADFPEACLDNLQSDSKVSLVSIERPQRLIG